MIKLSTIRIALFALVMLVMTGCAHVQPWERGILAKPQMAVDPSPLQTGIRNHNYNSREAAASINSSGGRGGCGCY